MATFILVHGAWGGGFHYAKTARQLRQLGHDVHVAGLTGLGERLHLASPSITLSTHVQDVVGLIDMQRLSDIILVGHSYGGMVITGAAGARADKIRSLVYVDAFLPEDGQSLWDIADEAARDHYITAQRDMPGLVAPFGGMPADPRVGRHPLLTLIEPVKTGGAEQQISNRTYIYATRGIPTTFSRFHARVSADSRWRVHEVDTGHGVMTDDPDGFLALLLAEVDR
jgi:pimeloyl-ACP methyl ester carboxylesterase